MVPSIARQSVILKCNMQKSVMLGNYEFFYAAGLMRKLYNIEIRTDMEPEQILEAILQMQDNLAPQSEQEKYLIQIIKNYEPSAIMMHRWMSCLPGENRNLTCGRSRHRSIRL